MISEIRLLKSDVDITLSNLRASIKALETTLSSSLGSRNVLETVDKLNKVNEEIIRLTEEYKILLLENEKSTQLSVEFMNNVDIHLSSIIGK